MNDLPAADGYGAVRLRRRSLLLAMLAAGVVVPLVGAGHAQASESTLLSEEDLVPEESGSVAWW